MFEFSFRQIAVAILIGGVTGTFNSCQKTDTKSAIDPNGPVEVIIPERGAYTGAFIDFGDEEDDVALEMIEDFEQMVGRHHYSGTWRIHWRVYRFWRRRG